MKTAHLLASLILLTIATSSHAGTFVGNAADRDGLSMPNVVFALKPVGAVAPQTAPSQIVVSQEALAFKPYLSVIRAGSSVLFPNRDRVEHHIKSFSSSKPFEIAVHKPGDTPAPIRFDKEGVVVAYCILHDWMRAYVYVADTPWFGQSAEAGLGRIENVPAGDYEVIAWHPDLGQYKPPLTAKVTIAASGTVQSNFKFDFKPKALRQPKPASGKPVAMHQH